MEFSMKNPANTCTLPARIMTSTSKRSNATNAADITPTLARTGFFLKNVMADSTTHMGTPIRRAARDMVK